MRTPNEKSIGSFAVYKKVAEEFLISWKQNKNVLGALLVGSYAVGLATPQSDIDICIILRDTIRHWERGNLMVSGFLVEYALYPLSYLKKREDMDLETVQKPSFVAKLQNFVRKL